MGNSFILGTLNSVKNQNDDELARLERTDNLDNRVKAKTDENHQITRWRPIYLHLHVCEWLNSPDGVKDFFPWNCENKTEIHEVWDFD